MDDVPLAEMPLLLLPPRFHRSRPLHHRIPYRTRHLRVARVRTADVQYRIPVPLGHLHRPVHRLQYIRLDQLTLPENLYAGAVLFQQIAMLHQLRELHLGHVHQRIDLVLGPLEVLDGEGVDGDHLDAGFVADLEDLGERFEALVVALDDLDAVLASESSVPIHDKGDVLGYGTLTQGADEELTQLHDGPFYRRGLE